MKILQEQGRRTAALLFIATLFLSTGLAGCARVLNVLPGVGGDSRRLSDEALSQRAQQIPYASIDLHVNGTGGLMVLTERAGRLTYWQTGQKQTLVFRNGRLDQTTGLPTDLVFSRDSADWAAADAPVASARETNYEVTRIWQTDTGADQALAGRATLDCDERSSPKELPLVTLPLQRCSEVVQWRDGAQTASLYWRDMNTGRIWAAESVPWPGGPKIDWQVVRPWW